MEATALAGSVLVIAGAIVWSMLNARADLVLLAQRRRDLLRHPHQAPTEARRVPTVSISRPHQPLPRRGQS